MAKHNPVTHFEMPYENRDRAAKFYESAFGWKMKSSVPNLQQWT